MKVTNEIGMPEKELRWGCHRRSTTSGVDDGKPAAHRHRRRSESHNLGEEMRVRSAVALCVVLLFGTVTFAQDFHKTEVGLNYSYTRFNPENQVATGGGGFSLNGGGGDITYFLTKNFGIKGEFEGTTSQTRNFTIPAPFCVPDGTNCVLSVQGNLFTYNAEAVYKARMGKFEPYVEGGFGGAHTNAYGNLANACGTGCNFVKKPSNNAWDFVIGGGFDIPVTPHVAIRPAQFDFLLTRFGNGFTSGNNNQSNFRYQAGVIFRF
jgi:outer membrane protein with beta-barrel domain